MGKIAIKNQPCLDQDDCKSSDARQVYEEGTSFCFACKKWFPAQEGGFERAVENQNKQVADETLSSIKRVHNLTSQKLKDRGISKGIAEIYGVKVSFNEDGEIIAHYYPYEDGKAYKKRSLPKSFSWLGHSTALFGRERFQAGGKRLIICEGEIDTLSVGQAVFDKYGKLYPVVGLSSSVMTASLLENREWIRSFQEVIICFDNDEAGKKATVEAVRIVGADKAKIASITTANDANDILITKGSPALMQILFDAASYVPSGIIGKEALWDALSLYNSVASIPYPACLAGVNTKLKGMRGGEITLFISGTGSGKSTMLREIIVDLLENTPEAKIGIVSLEESPAETARKLAGMALNRNPAKEEIPLDELKPGFDKIFGDDRVTLLDHQGSISDQSIIDKLEYMCLSGCTHLFIDHITILVSEGVDKLQGNEAQDKIMNELLKLVKRYPQVWIGLVSHLRKTGQGGQSFEEGKLPAMDDIKGSGSIKQISFDIISFARDMNAEDEKVRNTILMRVLKSRFTGLTGTVRGARYDYDTGRLIGIEESEATVEDFVAI